MEDYIVLSSTFRDTAAFPHVNFFRNNLTSTLKNVTELTLISVILPKPTTLSNSGMLFLVLNESWNINKVVFPSTLNSQKTIRKAFSPLPLTNSTATNFISSDFDSSSYAVKMTPPKDFSNYFEIQILDITGTPFSFGETAGDLTQANQLSLIFKVKYDAGN